jgi:hypothetical protein
VHRTWVSKEEANELLRLAVSTNDPELLDFARYAQSVADTTGWAVEPEPGFIQKEIEKGKKEMHQVEEMLQHPEQRPGMVVSGVGYAQRPQQRMMAPQWLRRIREQRFDKEQLMRINKIAERTNDQLLKETAMKAEMINRSELPHDEVEKHLFSKEEVAKLWDLANRTQDSEIMHFARYAQSVWDTFEIGLQLPGEVDKMIEKGEKQLQEQRATETPTFPKMGDEELAKYNVIAERAEDTVLRNMVKIAREVSHGLRHRVEFTDSEMSHLQEVAQKTPGLGDFANFVQQLQSTTTGRGGR